MATDAARARELLTSDGVHPGSCHAARACRSLSGPKNTIFGPNGIATIQAAHRLHATFQDRRRTVTFCWGATGSRQAPAPTPQSVLSWWRVGSCHTRAASTSRCSEIVGRDGLPAAHGRFGIGFSKCWVRAHPCAFVRDHSYGRRQRARTSLNQRTGRHTHIHNAHVRFVARCLGHLEDERIRRPSASQVVALAI